MVTYKCQLSRKGLWYLFSVSAFPIHVWAIVLFLRDFSWLANRTNAWDAIGVGSYGLLIAFVESVIIFILSLIIILIFPIKWPEERRIATIGLLTLMLTTWALLGQLYFLLGLPIPNAMIHGIARASHPLRVLYGGLMLIIGASLSVPSYFLLKSTKFSETIFSFFERLTTLTSLYLFLDFCGLAIIIIRNF